MDPGPFKSFLEALHGLQSEFPMDSCPIRTALVTARGAPTHERVIRTLRQWNIRIDESLFLGGLDKTAFLKSFNADISIFYSSFSKDPLSDVPKKGGEGGGWTTSNYPSAGGFLRSLIRSMANVSKTYVSRNLDSQYHACRKAFQTIRTFHH